MKSSGGKSKALIIIGAAIFLAIVFFFSSTGFYCKVPVAGTSKGESIWFLKRGTDFGFVNSADGIAMNLGFSPNDRIRTNLDAEFERLVRDKIILRFGFSRALYLMTTDNIDFYSPEEPANPGAKK
jgi:hypothetical protein